MLSTSALCLVLALSSTFALETSPESLVGWISSTVAHDMAQVAKSADGWSTLMLNNRLLATMRSSLKRLEPELRQLYAIRGGHSNLAKWISLKISQNRELVDALAAEGKTAPRFLGALTLGIAQIATDIVKMGLTRY